MPNDTIPLPEPDGSVWVGGWVQKGWIGKSMHAHAAAVTAAKDARIKVLEDALRKACDDMEGWGLYAPEYFREKHDFVGDVEAARAALGDKND